MRKLTGARARARRMCREAGVEGERQRTAVFGVRLKGNASGLLGSTGGLAKILRWCHAVREVRGGRC